MKPERRGFAASAVANKQQLRERLAALPFAEKLAILERLRDRSRAIATAGLRKVQTSEARRRP